MVCRTMNTPRRVKGQQLGQEQREGEEEEEGGGGGQRQ